VSRISRETAAFLKDPAVLKIFAEQQIVASYRDSDDFSKYIGAELDKWGPIIKTLGIKGE
jgi:tripartite-type tricarboxylate transporter receptor subunit TctC